MTKDIVVAIISGITGIAGGIIAWIQAIRIARIKADIDMVQEKIKTEARLTLGALKAESERRRKAFEIASQESEPIELALSQAWHDIQVIKETLSKLIAPISYDLNLALKSLKASISSLTDGYAIYGAALPEDARNAWHSSKKSAAGIQLSLTTIKLKSGIKTNLPPLLIDVLKEERLSLTDNQTILASARQNVRNSHIKKILDIM